MMTITKLVWTIVFVTVLGMTAVNAAAGEDAASTPAGDAHTLNPKLVELKPNTWLKLHELKGGDPAYFGLQAHGGSCFDTKRGKFVVFGSNTHGKDWNNSVMRFDPVTVKWERMYPQDTLKTYTVNDKGLPVCGENGDRPWATHTFGAVCYDESRDEMVVACHPGHMAPNKWGKSVKHLWGKIKNHPTWTFNFDTKAWTPLDTPGVSFFPAAATYDSANKTIIGYKSSGVYVLSGEPRKWEQTVKGGFFGWHNNAAFDRKHNVMINFGTNKNSDEIVVYVPATKEHKKMPTKGVRPPPDQHNPMEFVPEIGKTVILVDRAIEGTGKSAKKQAETWCYDYGEDAWTQIKEATLPFGCGMNYTMEYDPHHKVLLLAVAGWNKPPVMWALKVK